MENKKFEDLLLEFQKEIIESWDLIFDMDFEAQVPVQIRRAGRNNAEGVRFSMSQWYPKMCEYDKDGWHPNPYIAREFYGVWGDFDVTINIDSSFVTFSNNGEIIILVLSCFSKPFW